MFNKYLLAFIMLAFSKIVIRKRRILAHQTNKAKDDPEYPVSEKISVVVVTQTFFQRCWRPLTSVILYKSLLHSS